MGIRIYSDKDNDSKESMISKEIVGKILDYGISQKQILYIINDLSMNLENRDHMRRLVSLVRDLKEDMLKITTKSPLEV